MRCVGRHIRSRAWVTNNPKCCSRTVTKRTPEIRTPEGSGVILATLSPQTVHFVSTSLFWVTLAFVKEE